MATIKGHKLILSWTLSKPSKFLSPEDEAVGNINAQFFDLEQQDQLFGVVASLLYEGRNSHKDSWLWIGIPNLD